MNGPFSVHILANTCSTKLPAIPATTTFSSLPRPPPAFFVSCGAPRLHAELELCAEQHLKNVCSDVFVIGNWSLKGQPKVPLAKTGEDETLAQHVDIVAFVSVEQPGGKISAIG
jgi:hypothetical protein